MNLIKENIGSTHFLGVGGVGMSALAKMCLKAGTRVTGSDLKENRRTEELRGLGAVLQTGRGINPRRDVFRVVRSSAIPENDEELKAYREMGVPVLHRSDLLAEFIEERKSIAVAGTHGKTTTSALLYHILASGGLSPTGLLGGELVKEKSNCIVGRSDLLIAEADESDGSLSKFNPNYGILTSIDPDINVTSEEFSGCPFDTEKALDEVTQVFLKFCMRVKEKLLLCSDHPNVAQFLKRVRRPHWMTYGLEAGADLRAVDVKENGHCTQARIILLGQTLGTVRVPLPGLHNLANCLAAIGIALHTGLTFSTIAEAVENFRGVRRRFEIVGDRGGVLYVDDYAHNPQKVSAALAGAKAVGRKRTVAVFQPHRYTRTKLLLSQYEEAFDDADKIVVTGIFAAGEDPIPGVSGRCVYSKIKTAYPDKQVHFAPAFGDVKNAVRGALKPGDLVIGLGAGSVGEWIKRLAQDRA